MNCRIRSWMYGPTAALLTMTAVLCLATIVQAENPAPANAGPANGAAANDGLVVEYRFEGNASDTSGNGRHGALQGQPEFVEGRHGQCLALDGRDDYVDSLLSLAELGNEFTVECWINPAESQSHVAALFGNHYHGGTGLVIEQSPGQVNRFYASYGTGGRWVLTSPVPLAPGKWQHVALVKTPDELRFYLNGRPISVVRDNAPFVPSGKNLLVGCSIDDPNRRFRGLIDEFRVWQRAVTEFELDLTLEERLQGIAQVMRIVMPPVTKPAGAVEPSRRVLALDQTLLPDVPDEVTGIRLQLRVEEVFSGRQEVDSDLLLAKDKGFSAEVAFPLPPGYYHLRYRLFFVAGNEETAGPEGMLPWAVDAAPARVTPAEASGRQPLVPTTVSLLDGDTWQIATDPQDSGTRENWPQAPVKEAEPARVPGPIQDVFPDYHGVAWYWRPLSLPKNPHADGRYLLRFGAVDYLADIWLNGVHVGTHEGGETPFVVDVTVAADPSGPNLLAVRVLNPAFNVKGDGHYYMEKEYPSGCKQYPVQMNSTYNSGGIVESVELLAVPPVRLDDLHLLPDWKTGDIRVRATVRNVRESKTTCHLRLTAAPSVGGPSSTIAQVTIEAGPGESLVETTLHIPEHRLWELNDPYLYRVTASVWEKDSPSFDERSQRCGFRDFRFENGHFRLNGRRIFPFGSIYIAHYPLGHTWPFDPDQYRRDVLHFKASGQNFCRFSFGGSIERQLDAFDELGVMVALEHYGSWQLGDSPEMKRRFDRSMSEVVRRARNHPSVVAWGVLNEMGNGPVFRHAAASLPLVRWLDPSRMAILNSGRFDGVADIGSLANPGVLEWQDVIEDIHPYRPVPFTPGEIQTLRSFGGPDRPVFVSEYGQCGAMDLPRVLGRFDSLGRSETPDARWYRRQWEQFLADWKALRLDACWPLPEDFVADSIGNLARLRRVGETALRANPNLVAYSSTHPVAEITFCGSGMANAFRELKPGLLDATLDAGAPLRWCLFAQPVTVYRSGTVRLEAVLSNLDVLKPGRYAARFHVFGPASQRVLEKAVEFEIPSASAATEPPFAQPVFSTEITVDGPEGQYRFLATLDRGGAPSCGEAVFHVLDAAQMPKPSADVVLWGEDDALAKQLTEHGVKTLPFDPANQTNRQVILAAGKPPAPGGAAAFRDLAGQVARGSSVVFLDPAVFREQDQPTRWLPLPGKGTVRPVDGVGSYYRGDVWAKDHPIFTGLPSGGVLDYQFYREIIPLAAVALAGLEPPAEAVCGSTRLSCQYDSGLHVAVYRLGAGSFLLNNLRIRENLGVDPVAERLLRNMLNYAARNTNQPTVDLPADFQQQLKAIGYE